MADRYEALERLQALREAGTLSEAEFEAEKRRLLAEPETVAAPVRKGPPVLAILGGIAALVAMAAGAWLLLRASETGRADPVAVAQAPVATKAKVEPPPVQTKASEPTRAAACRGVACRVLTRKGWGGIEAGMTVARAEAASGMTLEPKGQYDEVFADEPGRADACNVFNVIGAPRNVSVFVEDGVVTSIGLEAPEGSGDAHFATDLGVAIGDSEAAVRRAYGMLKAEPDIYSAPPDKLLFAKGADGNGIKFHIVGGKVKSIDVGGKSINYVEGCI